MYQVVISEPAKKFIKKLQQPFVRKIISAIEKFENNLRPHGCKQLVGSDLYRMRVGDYRIIYSIDDEVKIVDVRKVGHRKNIYD